MRIYTKKPLRKLSFINNNEIRFLMVNLFSVKLIQKIIWLNIPKHFFRCAH